MASSKQELDGKKTIIEYETGSGVLFHITPINLPTLRAIQMKAEQEYPYPDKAPYQQLEENAFTPGQLTPAEDNPEYIKACQAIDTQRSAWTDRTIFNYAAKIPKYPTRESVINAFRTELDELRKWAVLDNDDYEAIMSHLILTWNQPTRSQGGALAVASNDYARIIQCAIQTVALSPAEVQAGVRMFRPKL